MQNFAIHFTYPWLLLLLIPAIGVALIPFFRIQKKYRYTRNRVCSVILHNVIMILAIFALAGMNFSYTVANDKNEIILLVDMSDSQEEVQQQRDDFVQTVLYDGRYDNYRIGIVTFGFTQQYAVPLTTDVDDIYERYIAAELPDTSATDIAAALNYTKDLFDNPETGKIVLITDGKETDESAKSVVRSIAAKGIKVDVADISAEDSGREIQVTDLTLPNYHVNVDEECTLSVTLQTKVDNVVEIELWDNRESQGTVAVAEIKQGMQTIEFTHTFASFGLHEIQLKVSPQIDNIEANNQFYTYLNLESFNKILVLDRFDDSTMLSDILTKDDAYDVTVLNISEDAVPTTVDELREYDQVILNNIANSDMPEGFSTLLYSYVYDYGGGLFTTGGSDESGNAHAYNRSDMYGTAYQQMLPVQAINYTPPVGVIVVVDRSGSMSATLDDGTSYLDWAKAGATACLDALTERDYFGFMTLESDYNVILDLTPVPQRARILSAIESVNSTEGGTVFTNAIDRAGLALRGLKSVDRKHIIVVTDGALSDKEKCIEIAQSYYETDGITISVVGIGVAEDSSSANNMQELVDVGHGRLHTVTKSSQLVMEMREDLNAPSIKELNPETFEPIIYNNESPLLRGIERDEDSESRKRLTVELDGFYGVKARDSAEVVLVGEYDVPIYAQWKYGAGMVGSFMCDVSGVWSNSFLSDANGQQFLYNVVRNLMPTENIRSNEIGIVMQSENYINKMSILTDLNEGEYLTGTIAYEDEDGDHVISMNTLPEGNVSQSSCYVTVAMDASNNFSRCYFVAKASGVYTLTIIKHDAAGNELARNVVYHEFSYSAEYKFDDQSDDIKANLETIAERGNGSVIADHEDPHEIFDGFVTRLPRAFDPRIVLMILVIVLFLLDIAVRKFKFKWIHELVREHHEKKKGAR